MKKLLFILFATAFLSGNAQKSAFQLYSKDGKKTTYEALLKDASNYDIILFGELHNNSVCHWLELEFAKDFYKDNKNLMLSAEMFEADDQIVMNEYLNGTIEHKHFETEAKMWNNYKTDYKPLVEFAKENKLGFTASNVPRRYANVVARNGIKELDNMTNEAKAYFAPLPIEIDLTLPGYKMFLDMKMGHGSEMTPQRMAEAQAVKDATMAYFTHKYKGKNKVIHYNGAYHSDNFEGIYYYLKKLDSTLKILTITTVELEDIQNLDAESKGKADFIIAIPENMTKTY